MTENPSKIKAEDIQKLAHLARLGVQDDELGLFAKDMNRLIDWVSILQSAPTEHLEPLTHPHDNAASHLREDMLTEKPGSDALFNNAKQHQDQFFLVPQVIQ